MKNVKAPTSDSYQDSLISHLKDPSYAAIYLETYLEENDAEPELLELALSNISEALSQSKMSSEQAKLHHQRIAELLSQPGNLAIQNLAHWLSDLGLKLTVTVDVS
jgi:DNA-binding phage protein